MDLPATLRAVRAATGLTQYDFAEWVHVSRKTVQRWEAGTAAPDARAEEALVEFCRGRGAFTPGHNRALAAATGGEPQLRSRCAAARAEHAIDRVDTPRRDPAPEPVSASSEGGRHIPALDLFGRDEALASLLDCLGRHRLVTLTGPGGVGKTAVAEAVVRVGIDDRPTDFVMLAPIEHAGGVLGAIATAVGATEAAGRSRRESVIAALDDGERLLVLDNFEHVLDAAPVVADLLDSVPSLKVLVTSRAPLRLRDEAEMPVSPLAVPDVSRDLVLAEIADSPALQLFVARARLVDPAFVLTLDGARATAALCTALDGLPLAIELAAARVRLLPPTVLNDRLGARLHLLEGPIDGPRRHQTLDSTVRWSYDLLDPTAQRLLRAIAIFAGAFTLADAEALGDTAGGRDPVLALGDLVDHSLVQSISGGEWFRLAETVREFARSELVAHGERPEAAAAHARRMRLLAEAEGPRLHGPEQAAALEGLSRRGADLGLALEHFLDIADNAAALELTVAMCGFWDARSALSVARDSLDRCLGRVRAPTPLRLSGLLWSGYFAALQMDLTAAQALGVEALELAEHFDTAAGRGYAHMVLGGVAVEAGDDAVGRRHYEASLAHLTLAGDRWGTARPLNSLAEIARAGGEPDRAVELHTAALTVCRELGDEHSQVMVLCGLGQAVRLGGDAVEATRLGREAARLGRALDNGVGLATALELLAALASDGGDHEEAAQLWGRADALRHRTGSAVEVRDQPDQQRTRARTVRDLGDVRFDAHHAAGAARPTLEVLRGPPD